MNMTTQAQASPKLDAINALDRDAFVAELGGTFEHAPWVARTAWTDRPFASVDELHAAMLRVVHAAPPETQIGFLRGHPELAGKEATAGTMTDESVGEQASAGLDALSPAEFTELAALNRRYLDRHGFPFIIAVRQHGKQAIFEQLRQRAERDSGAELEEAIRPIALITKSRVEARSAC